MSTRSRSWTCTAAQATSSRSNESEILVCKFILLRASRGPSLSRSGGALAAWSDSTGTLALRLYWMPAVNCYIVFPSGDAASPVEHVREIETISRRAPIPCSAVAACKRETLAKANNDFDVSGTPSFSITP